MASFIMLIGSSDRGLSEVSTTMSLSSAAAMPISGRFARSRSPPQPKSVMTRLLRQTARDRDEVAQGIVGVRVVDHDEKRLPHIHTLEAARHGGAVAMPSRDYLRPDPDTIGRAPCRQEVIDIDFARPAATPLCSPAVVVNLKAEPVKIGCDVLRARGCSFSHAIRDHLSLGFGSNGGCVRVVMVDDGKPRSRGRFAREKHLLCLEIGVHVAVEVQVIPGQVRKHRCFELNAVNPAQTQARARRSPS